MLDRDLLAPNALTRWAAATPEAVALEHVDGERWTYAELHAESLRWAGALAGLGVGFGTHVATMLTNTSAAHRTMLALGLLRAVEVPVNTSYLGPLLRYVLDHSDATVLIVATDFIGEVEAVRGDLPKLATVVVVGGDDPAYLSIDDLVRDATPIEGASGPDPWDVACLLFTSGTTGPSKAVVTPWGGVLFQMWSWVPADTLEPGGALYNALPLFHNSGRAGFNYSLAVGARFVFRDKFSGSQLWDDVRRTRCTAVALVGAMMALVHGAPPSPDDAEHQVRSVICGPMIPEVEDFEHRFGVRVATCYGQTEIGAPVATGWDHGPWATCGRLRLGYPDFEVRLVDEHDAPVGVGEVGEMIVRTAEPWALNLGYYGMAAETVDAWRNGWFHTGDAFRCDEDGWYYFVDRMKDTLRRRGENISSFEVEAVVAQHPGVVECAAVGVRNALGDDDVHIAVVAGDPASFDPSELIGFLIERMPRFMVPRYVTVMDDLPRNATTRRVRKNELRALGVLPTSFDCEHTPPE
jgi:crotonobetaine/carnitine-CoA ligase